MQKGGETMMATYTRKDHRINVGLPQWLYEVLQKRVEAKRETMGGSWDISKEVRLNLVEANGATRKAALPQRPSHEHHPTRQGKRS